MAGHRSFGLRAHTGISPGSESVGVAPLDAVTSTAASIGFDVRFRLRPMSVAGRQEPVAHLGSCRLPQRQLTRITIGKSRPTPAARMARKQPSSEWSNGIERRCSGLTNLVRYATAQPCVQDRDSKSLMRTLDSKPRANRYWITLSARTMTSGGNVMPSALAVFILMTSSNSVGCWTGKSSAFAPLRILAM